MSKGAGNTDDEAVREARDSVEEDTLLLFRLGDFFEMFESDAERGRLYLVLL